MKKRILSILLTLCMVLVLCPVTAFAEGTGSIAITANGFEVGRTPNDIKYTVASTTPGITFSASDILYVAWQEFDGSVWDGVSKTEAFKADTTYRCVIALDNKGLDTIPAITMNGKTPEYCEFGIKNDVPVQFEMITTLGTPANPPTLDITANGFEVGKTPNDIKYTVASTTPGVTFSASDILYVAWQEFDGSVWDGVSKTEAFKADTTYRCVIALDNKGLDTIPAITMNGKTPEYCEFGIKNDVPVQFEMITTLGTPATAFADEHVYRVAGTAELCGSFWIATDDDNRMTYNEETGRFEKVYTDVAADSITGYEYKVVVDGATWIPDGSGPNPTVYVEEDNATVTIWYDENTGEWGADVAYGTPVAPTLAITVEGFEAGKTPADIKYSFASTIPGVEFSEDDITRIAWGKYVFEGSHYKWVNIPNTNVFEAGASYQISMNLDNKGLNMAPAVTVNGKTPEYCTIATSNGVPIQLQITCELGTPATAMFEVTQNFQYGTRVDPGDEPRTNPYTFEIPAGGSFGLATIEDCAPYELVGWKESVSGTVYAPYAEIQNLQSDLTFDAVYQVQGGLAITVDGFEVGKTPNDITYSFESTIPGVTFDEKDIKYLCWNILRAGRWEPIIETEAFEAGTSYRFEISLKNNGLELVPATTANGIAPMYSQVVSNNGVPYAINMEFELGTPVAPTLAITVDNFEVGKTLADCTFSFASTIPGVTFDESDILGVYWEAYDPYAESFYQVDDSNVFQTGVTGVTGVPSYRCTIELDSKGLTVAPAATVNGNTPESCEIVTSGGKTVLRITCELGTPLAQQLTISGMSVVCKDQDYEFSVTAAEGAEALYFLYRCGEFGGHTGWDRTDGGVCYGTVPASDYRDADTLELTVYGTAANGKPATATKTVQILKEHRFVDGVCACGAVQLTLSVTIDGFEAGKTPADCTFSFASTIPSVSFSEEDILYVVWGKYDFEGDHYMALPVGENEVFEAGMRYDCVIRMNNNGLESAPDVTVNGNKPRYCSIMTRNGEPVGIEIVGELGTPAERSQYTITYDGGDGVEGSIDPETKADGVPVTLSSKTFKMDGFIQTGWIDKETDAIYELGATYDEDRDATFYPYWEKLVTVTAGFTTTVALGDAGEPGETTFELGLIDSEGYELIFDDQFIGAEITTDGAGSYSGTMTITATGKWLYDMLYEGAFIWQYDGEEEGWTYDDTVWGVRLYMPEVAARSADAVQYSLLLYPTYVMDNGSFNLDMNAGPVDEMTFTNTYTAHAYALKHDATHHWDECACKDVQNKELHTYGDWKVTKEATEKEAGEKEHTCMICSYVEKAKIEKLPATTDPTRPGTGAPATGDNSHMELWIALLFVSGAGVIVTTVYGKKKRAK